MPYFGQKSDWGRWIRIVRWEFHVCLNKEEKKNRTKIALINVINRRISQKNTNLHSSDRRRWTNHFSGLQHLPRLHCNRTENNNNNNNQRQKRNWIFYSSSFMSAHRYFLFGADGGPANLIPICIFQYAWFNMPYEIIPFLHLFIVLHRPLLCCFFSFLFLFVSPLKFVHCSIDVLWNASSRPCVIYFYLKVYFDWVIDMP